MIFAIGDLHLDSLGQKPMNIFGKQWENHEEKIFSNWKKIVTEKDLVLLPGDISWALHLSDAINDLKKIDKLPGRKIISKGNHDYWWSSMSKLNKLEFPSIEFLHNNFYVYKNFGISGTRGWIAEDNPEFKLEDKKIFDREVMRLKNSLEKNMMDKKIVMIHYPPFNQDFSPNSFSKLMSEYNVSFCLYGHLHGKGHKFAFNGKIGEVEYRCVSSDYISFELEKVI